MAEVFSKERKNSKNRVASQPGNLENLELSGNSNQPGKDVVFFRKSVKI